MMDGLGVVVSIEVGGCLVSISGIVLWVVEVVLIMLEKVSKFFW